MPNCCPYHSFRWIGRAEPRSEKASQFKELGATVDRMDAPSGMTGDAGRQSGTDGFAVAYISALGKHGGWKDFVFADGAKFTAVLI